MQNIYLSFAFYRAGTKLKSLILSLFAKQNYSHLSLIGILIGVVNKLNESSLDISSSFTAQVINLKNTWTHKLLKTWWIMINYPWVSSAKGSIGLTISQYDSLLGKVWNEHWITFINYIFKSCSFFSFGIWNLHLPILILYDYKWFSKSNKRAESC